MAQKVQILLLDDLDGSEATETVTFGLDGSTYEIDLNPRNADRLRKALEPFIAKARKVRGGPGRRPRPPRTSSQPKTKPETPAVPNASAPAGNPTGNKQATSPAVKGKSEPAKPTTSRKPNTPAA